MIVPFHHLRSLKMQCAATLQEFQEAPIEQVGTLAHGSLQQTYRIQ